MGGTAVITLDESFGDFIRDRSFPCFGVKSALAKNQIEVIAACDIRAAGTDIPIHSALRRSGLRQRLTRVELSPWLASRR